jgi:hypothetical protein
MRNQYVQAAGKAFVWHQVFGASEQTALDFYTRALDWGVQEYSMGEWGTYKMLTIDGCPVAGVVGTEGNNCTKDVPPNWQVSIGVDDVDARVAKCVSLGATIIQEPMDIPTVGRMAVIQDPQGAVFSLFKGF